MACVTVITVLYIEEEIWRFLCLGMWQNTQEKQQKQIMQNYYDILSQDLCKRQSFCSLLLGPRQCRDACLYVDIVI